MKTTERWLDGLTSFAIIMLPMAFGFLLHMGLVDLGIVVGRSEVPETPPASLCPPAGEGSTAPAPEPAR